MSITKQQTWADVLTELVRRSAIPANAHRILLYGPPGTGKSSWAQSAFAHVERVTLHAQMPPEDLVGAMALVARNGGTETVWTDGPAVRAMRQPVFVAEPYLELDDDFSDARDFADRLDCNLVVDEKSYWYPGKTIRLAIVPKK